MATTLKNVKEIFKETIEDVSKDSHSWQTFISCAAMNYKYDFSDQLLIYAQKPTATACADYDTWNNDLKRYINKDSKGIALLTEVNGYPRIRYVFDVSDTHSKYGRNGKKVRLWTIPKSYENQVKEALQNKYDISSDNSFIDVLKTFAFSLVENNYQDYFNELLDNTKNTRLEFISRDVIDKEYKKLLTNSVSFMILKRCGIDPSPFFISSDFDNISMFQDLPVITRLGSSISEISEMGLREIYTDLKNIRISEINKIRTFDKDSKKVYDESAKAKEAERRNQNENNLHESERNQFTKYSSNTERGNTSREIWNNEARVLEEAQEERLSSDVDGRYIDRPLERDTSNSREQGNIIDKSNDGTRGINRRIESDRPNEMGGLNEQHEVISRGNNNERIDLRLEDKDTNNSVPFLNEEKYSYKVGDHIFIGEDEYIIEKIGIFDIDLHNPSMPLFGRTMNIVEFESKLRENPANDHLKVIEEDKENWYGEFNDEIDLIEHILHQHKIDDIKMKFDDDCIIIAKDDEGNVWVGKEFYDFLFNDLFVYNEDGTVSLIDNNDLERLKEYRKKYLTDYQKELTEVDKICDIIHESFKNLHQKDIKALEDICNSNNMQLDDYLYNQGYGDFEDYISELEELNDVRSKNDSFDSLEFEKKLPHNMRFKEAYTSDNNLYWVTQEFFTQEDLVAFQNAFKETSFDNAYITTRDLSKHYDFAEDMANNVLAVVTKIGIYPADYFEAVEKIGMDKVIKEKAPTEKNVNTITPNEVNQLSLFASREQELAERLLDILNSFDTKWKGNLELSSVEVKKWDHVKSKKRNLSITIKSNKFDSYDDNAFTQFNTDKEDEITLRNGIDNDEFIQYLNQDNDFSIYLSPTLINIYYHNFDDKNIDLSVGKNNILSQVNNEENITVIDDVETVIEPKRKKKVRGLPSNYILHPEVPYEDRINYKITNNDLGVGTPKERFKNNIEAIKVLKKCEAEDRYATSEEQEILVKYVGWGGLSLAFDKNNASWSEEYDTLKSLLTEEEYKKAFDSTLTSFYTPPVVINAMYKALSNMGLNKGNILEPSCGTGNFIGMLPNNDNLKIYGVEIDEISGRIARQLYQKSSIAIKGFEDVDYSDSFFDVVIGNVPFGENKVYDKRYDKHNFLIHDYFFAKSIDKIRPGGVLALITSKGTLDKPNSNLRRYLASRADLIGAIRLPNNVFKGAAGTTVTSDIIFLQKRDSILNIEPNWLNIGTNYQGITMNNYFIDHPENILGEMKMISGRFGMESACLPYEDQTLEESLNEAISNIHAEIKDYKIDDLEEEEYIEADLNVNNFSYTVVDNKVYYRENSRMYPQKLALTTENRVKGLVELRDCTRNLINLQLNDFPEEDIKLEQDKLNALYDSFTHKYGLINSKANNIAFSNDNSYYLLCSLEILDDNGNLKRKADMFTKRTIKAHKEHKIIKDANDALIVSIGEKARVDLDYMADISFISKDQLIKDLEGKIFKIPGEDKYVTADEYLSGNIREKIKEAELYNQTEHIYDLNLKYLNDVMPEFLHANDISVRLGSTWIPKKYYEEFMFNLLEADNYTKGKIKINYSDIRDEWSIEHKNCANDNTKVTKTYGTNRINAYRIIEETLNLKDVKIYDYFEDDEGKQHKVLNGKETAIAQAKQEQIKQAFLDWIWTNQERRTKLEEIYNSLFNSIVPREYDGSNIIFEGMNPEIQLREHQVNAIARVLYGGNTLLAHEVGAGKTFEMVASAMESKRLGLCNKSLFVVPNHIIEQFASEFLQLYPSANILVATKKDFETANRKKFCSRIATGEYDAIIIGHSQFEKIPMSIERQIESLEKESRETMQGIEDAKKAGATFTVKQLAKTQRGIETKLAKLNNTNRKDTNVVTFEQLGVDRLFIDEAHYYKNLYLYTKMRNVSGIAQTEAQKSSDLYMKCKYLDEITGNKGVIFATGTPVSNSMVELYSMQRYLQAKTLKKIGLQNFDAWASTFGETITALELTPEGNNYRAKTRFAKFHNLPELINIFKEVADIKTSDTLNLPVSEAKFESVVVKPSEVQLNFMKELSERAERIRQGGVDPHEDNMLKITSDGRKLGLDQRLINELLPDYEESKVNICADKVFKFYQDYNEDKLTQLVFCDMSTPKGDGSFNLYDDLREKLVAKGIPIEEIAFIHEAKNEVEKQEMFAKVRRGQIRVLIGSTSKMGAGTNCQDKIIAIHHLDSPYKPAELTQRNGRGIRQGNINKEIYIFNYVTEKTFDAYLYQILENKQKFISQIMTSKAPLRVASDVDETVLNYAEIKALAAGNPLILKKTDLEMKVSKLKLLKQTYLSQKYEIEDKIAKDYPQQISNTENSIDNMSKDLEIIKDFSHNSSDFSSMKLSDIDYNDKKEAGEALLETIKNNPVEDNKQLKIGNYAGLDMYLGFNFMTKNYYISLKNNHNYIVELGNDPVGNITRIDNELDRIDGYITSRKEKLVSLKEQLEIAKREANKPFLQEEELKEAIKELKEVDVKLRLNEKVNEVIDDSDKEEDSQVYKKVYER